MGFLSNSDLLILGVTVASTLILATTAFFSNVRDITNRFFLLFCITIVSVNVLDYLSYQFKDPNLVLWIVRFVIFNAVFQNYALVMFAFVFPKDRLDIRPLIKWGALILACITAALTLSNYVFGSIIIPPSGVVEAVPGPGILVFALFSVLTTVVGITILVRKVINSKTPEEKIQAKLLLWGIIVMYAFVIPFDFILPAVLNNSQFIPIASVFSLPFVLTTSYAVFKHHLMNIKVVTTEVLTFLLCVISLADVVSSTSILLTLFRSAVFIFVLTFSIFLIQSVIKEVKQRERSEKLADEVAVKNKELNQKTDELNKHLAEIERMNQYMADRDIKMNELNKELADLKTKLGQA